MLRIQHRAECEADKYLKRFSGAKRSENERLGKKQKERKIRRKVKKMKVWNKKATEEDMTWNPLGQTFPSRLSSLSPRSPQA